jgi:broad specificity phosphatase PhoE
VSILLIRHGETELNATRVVQPPDTPLNERGVAQADSLARRLLSFGVAHILASDQARARMTAERVLAATGATLSLDPGLCERNFGDVRGTPYSELEEDIFAPGYAPPGGERWSEFDARVDAAWDRVTARTRLVPGNLAVVTHGLVCRSLAARKLELPDSVAQPQRWGNTALTIVDGGPPWRVQLLNCTTHLEPEFADDTRGTSGL